MSNRFQRVFLDTNVYIIGTIDDASPEAQVLRSVGYLGDKPGLIEVVVCEDLFDELRRVAKRLRNKDWAGEILARIWQNLHVHYVFVDPADIEQVTATGVVPAEDVEVYLTARNGKAECFVSANHELIRLLVEHTREFECLTPAEFAAKYIRSAM